jgi:hypothetical protein
MVADDLTLMSPTAMGMQSLITEAELDASRERYTFSETKTKSITIKPKKNHVIDTQELYLNNNIIENKAEEVHIGIHRQANDTNTSTVCARITTARRTCYSLMGAGLHGLNGLCPKASKKIWAMYIFPRLTHGLESLCLSPKEITKMEDFYRGNLRALQHLPKSTSNAAVYLLLGVPPLEAQLHIKTLTFFMNMLRRPDSVEAAVIQRQASMASPKTNSWVTGIQHLLTRYGLPNSHQLSQELPTKLAWKREVRQAVLGEWSKLLKEEASQKSTLRYLNIERCSLQGVHTVWDFGATDQLATTKAANKAKLLVQRYPLYSSRTSGRNFGHDCPLCSTGEESMAHFLLHCPKLQKARLPYTTALNKLSLEHGIDITSMDDDVLCRIILDSSDTPYPTAKIPVLCNITRDLCFKLHHNRSVLMNTGSKYSRYYTRRNKGNIKLAANSSLGPQNTQ